LLNSGEYFLQKAVQANHEFASHILFTDKIRFIKTIQHTHPADLYIQGARDKAILSVESEPPVGALVEFERLLSALEYSGVCCIDYKVDTNSQLRILEINPRLGASLGLNKKGLDELLTTYREAVLFNLESGNQ
jgi:hypothetical protein